MRALITALAFVVAFVAPITKAQTTPSLSQPYCTAVNSAMQCFSTKAEAEAIIRQGSYAASQLRQTSISGTPTALYFNYNAQPSRPESYTPIYYNGGVAGAGCPAPGCSSEDEIVNNVSQYFASTMAGQNCTWQLEPITGAYYSPVTNIFGFGGTGRPRNGAFDFYQPVDTGNNRTLTATGTCFSPPGVVMQLVKSQGFLCPEDYNAPIINGSDASGLARAAQMYNSGILCYSGVAKYIMGLLLQVKSCPANNNPCYPATGDKFREEYDFDFEGLRFSRFYHSRAQAGVYNPSFAPGWTHSLSATILPANDKLFYTGDDGWIEPFVRPDPNNYLVYVSETTQNSKIVIDYTAQTKTLYTPDGYVRVFRNQTGKLLSVSNWAAGISIALNYDFLGRLSSAVSLTGRSLQFIYTDNVLTKIALSDGTSVQYGRDAFGNLTDVSYSDLTTKKYLYNESNLSSPGHTNELTGILINSSRYATFGYNSSGKAILSQIVGGETTTLEYTDDYHVKATLPTNEVVNYLIDPNKPYRRISAISGTQTSNTYSFSSNGVVPTQDTKNGVTTSYGYSSTYLSAQTEALSTPAQRRTEYTRDDLTYQLLQVAKFNATNTLVSKEQWTRNSRGQALTHSFIDPVTNATRTTTTSYCEDANICGAVGVVLSVTDPRNNATTYSYYLSDDPACASAPETCPHHKGDLWKVTNALGQVTETLAYDGAGRVLSVKDPNGVITDYAYTSRGLLASKTVRGDGMGADRQTRIEYWPTGLVSFVYQPDGSFAAFTYDTAQRLTDMFDNAGNKIHYTLDNAGNRTKEETSDPNGVLARTLSRVYNQLGQLQQSLTANGHATTYAYDANSNTTGVTDALGRITNNVYDPLGRLVQTLRDTAGINASTQFAYDTNDRLTQAIDPKGLATSYSYNGLGDLTQLASPDTGTVGYTYDGAGNRMSQTDARGITANYVYDALNRLVSISYPDPAYNQSYTYDALQGVCPTGEQTTTGFLTSLQAKGAATQYCYDRWGQLVRKVQTIGTLTQVTRYAYDNYGRLRGLIYPDGGSTDYVRNGLGQIVEVGYTPVNGSRNVVVTSVTYAPFGPATGWNYGNGRHLSRTLTLDYRPNAIYDSQAGGLSYAYGFDAVGNLGALKNGTQTTDLGKFVYDGLNRLTQQQNGLGGALYTWSYDATGNRTQAQSIVSGTQSYTYGVGNHHLSQLGAASRSYDAVGNTTDMGMGKGFGYGPDNRMTSVQSGSTPVIQYNYDARGQQILRANANATSVFVYDEAGRWLGEYSDTGEAKQQVIWLDDLPVGVVTTKNNLSMLAYIEPDHLGTPRAIIDAARNLAIWVWPLTSEAFGNSQPDQDPDGDGILFAFDMRFPGQRYDNVTGLLQNGYRDMDPGTGRYIESDPIGLNGGISTYAYSTSDPLDAFDPNGLQAFLTNLPPQEEREAGSIYCVDGVIKPYFNYDKWPPVFKQCKELSDCLNEHEMTHAADAYRSNPGVCKKSFLHAIFGTPPMVVTFPNKPYPGRRYGELGVSELHAHAAELRCLTKKLREMTSSCDANCRAGIIQRIRDINDTWIPKILDGTYSE